MKWSYFGRVSGRVHRVHIVFENVWVTLAQVEVCCLAAGSMIGIHVWRQVQVCVAPSGKVWIRV